MSTLYVKTVEPLEAERDGKRQLLPVGTIVPLARDEAFKLAAVGAVEICAEAVSDAPIEVAAAELAVAETPVEAVPVPVDEAVQKPYRKGR